VAKRSLKWTPLGPVLYFSGALLVDRGSGARAVASIRKACSALRKAGVSLVVFPEGTRNGARAPSLLPFKKGGFHMAVQSELPIVPVVCENYSHMYRLGFFEPVTLRARGKLALLNIRGHRLIPPRQSFRRFQRAAWVSKM
jgi:lysophosphatidate acyltransferase